MEREGDTPGKKISIIWWILLAAVALIVIYARVRLLDLPLERDEGEFATIGRQILSGIPPYSESFNLKPPGIYLGYGVVMALFGLSPGGIHFGLLLINLLTAGCLFVFTRASWGDRVAVLATAGFLVLSVSPRVLGISAHATHFVLLMAMAGLALLGPALRKRSHFRIIASGMLLGSCIMMKQPGIFFVLFGVVMIFRGFFSEEPKERPLLSNLLYYLLGVAIPVAVALLWMLMAGVWEKFWFWTVTYGFAYGSKLGIAEGLRIAADVVPTVVVPALILWIVAAYGIVASRREGADRFLLIFFLLLSFLAVTTGFHFRRHYFILMLPAVALFFGQGVTQAGKYISSGEKMRKFSLGAMMILAVAALVQPLWAGREVLFSLPPDRACREIFGQNPFVESEELAERVRSMTTADDRILVFGSEPQIYFYSGRRPASGYLYTYSLMEDQPYEAEMQKEMISEIERNRPKVILFVNVPWSWLLRPESDLSIVDWFYRYREREGYELAGIVDIVSMTETVWRWGPGASSYTPESKTFIEVWNLPD